MSLQRGACGARWKWNRWGLGLVFLLGTALSGAGQTAGVPPAGRPGETRTASVVLQPNTGRAGETLSVEAVGLHDAPGLTVAFEPAGLAVTELRRTERGVGFRLAIAAGARPGSYTLVVRGGDLPPRSFPAAFTVLPAIHLREEARVLRVEPSQVEPGKTYTLTLFGQGFVPDMTVSFGRDVQNLAPPSLQDSGRATLQVLVSPAALPGVRLASVKAPEGRPVEGPGGVQVLSPSAGKTPRVEPLTVPPVEVVIPKGKIFLRAPNITGSGEFVAQHMGDDPPLVQQGTQFTWFEQNPGVAQYFVLTIKDKSGKVLAQVQTPASKNYYRVTKQLLLSLPSYRPDLTFHYAGPEGLNLPAGAAGLLAGGGAKSQIPVRSGLPEKGGGPKITQAQIDAAIAMAKETGNLTAMVDPDLHLIRPTDHADATWSVTGYWKHPVTHENMAVETSEEYPLKLPRQPRGMLSCDAADQPGALRVVCVDPKDPNGSRACLVGHEVVLSGQIRLDRDPYPVSVSLHNFQDMAAQYTNVYLSWGDGEVTPLVVDRTPSGEPVVKIQYQGAGLRHVYRDEGDYLIQIYSLPNPESSNPALPALVQSRGPYAQSFQSLVQAGPAGSLGGSPSPGALQARTDLAPRGTGALPAGMGAVGTTGSAVFSEAGTVGNLLANDAYLIACTTVNPVYPEDMVATGPLRLKEIRITAFPGHPEKPPAVPEVKDCSQGFTAQAELSYYGQGVVGWSWIVDGVEIPGGTRAIGPARRTPPAPPEILVSDPLPVALTAEPHTLSVKAWVVLDADSDLMARLSPLASPHLPSEAEGYTNVSQSTKVPGASSGPVLEYAMLRPSLRAFTSVGAVVSSPSASSSSPKKGAEPGQESATSPPNVLPATNTLAAGSSVASPAVKYRVVAHDPGTPCSIFFQTARGPFVVTDLGADFAEQADGTYTGSGSLVLTLPEGQSGTVKVLVPVTFKGWTLEGSGDGREVVRGSLDVTPGRDVEVVGLTGKITRVTGTAGKGTGEVNVTFRLEPSSYSGLRGAGVSLAFEAKGPISPDGDFTAAGLRLQAADVGYSGYQVSASDAVLDLSRHEGDAPAETACNATGTGQQWVGLLLKNGVLKTGNLSLIPVPLPNVPFTRWSIGPGGLSGRLAGYPLNGSIPMGLTTIQVSTFDFFVCGKNLASTFSLTVKDYPFLNGTLSGTSTIDEHGVSQNSFDVPAVDKDFGTLHYTSSHGSFGFESGVGWRVVLDGTFRFKAFGKPAYDGLPMNGLQVLPTGELRLEGGAHTLHVPLGGSGYVGQAPVDVTAADVAAADYGGATAKALFFKLSAVFHLSNTLSVAPSTLTYRLLPVQGQPGHFSAADPAVDDLHIENHYPYNSDVNMNATVSYKDMGSGNTRFSGKAQLQLVQGTVDAEFLLGYQNGQDYWLTRVGYDLGAAPVGILPPFLMLYEVHGALGHNINFSQAAAGVPIEQIQPVFDGSYLFQAGCQVGDGFSEGWIYYFDGTFTVDTQQGARIDAKGWLLTTAHSGSAPLNGTLQYGGGTFMGSLNAKLRLLGGAVTFSGDANLLLGDNWHVWIDSAAHVLVADCSGSLRLDGNGLKIGGSFDADFSAHPTIFGVGAYVEFKYYALVSLGITKDDTYGIHLDGSYLAGVSGSAGITLFGSDLGCHIGGSLKLSASAMPVSVCGDLQLDFGCICVCPCWDFSWECCCECFRPHVGICLP